MNWDVPLQPPSAEWTAEDRLRVIVAGLLVIQTDIPAGRYGEPGRVNCQALLHVATEDASVLESYRAEIEAMLAGSAL